MKIRWLPITDTDRKTGATTVDQNALRSDCGQYTLSRHNYAGETFYEAFAGRSPDQVFLQRSLDRAVVEQACNDHKAQHAPKQVHEHGDGV